jgi:hypothetical protein
MGQTGRSIQHASPAMLCCCFFAGVSCHRTSETSRNAITATVSAKYIRGRRGTDTVNAQVFKQAYYINALAVSVLPFFEPAKPITLGELF